MQYGKFQYVFIVLILIVGSSLSVTAQSVEDSGTGSADPAITAPAVVASAAPAPSIGSTKPPDKRLFGVVPNYRTTNAAVPFSPITARHKLGIASRDSFDWPTYPLAALMTLMMPGKEETKAYGTGWSGFGNRYARNMADQIVGNMLTEGLLPSVLHEDPRYFRPGTGTFWSRLKGAVNQIVITRKDSGARALNTSEFLGNAIAVGISNTYSPNLRTWGDSTEKLGLMIGTDLLANVVKEFGPDVKERFLHRHRAGT